MGSRKEQTEAEEAEAEAENQLRIRKRKRKGKGKGAANTGATSDVVTNNNNNKNQNKKASSSSSSSSSSSASSQLRFFVDEFQSAKGVQLSSLELDSLKDSCIFEVPHSDVQMLGKYIIKQVPFRDSWKELLCEAQLLPGKIDAGCPALLLLASSALRSIHLLRGFRSLTKHCHAAKLFSKHMKLEQQIALLKNRVNIASGTPSRIKKLIDSEALGLSRLKVVVLDMHTDVKGYSLFTLPQVRDEFWDLFKNYLYEPMVQGNLRICLYGPYQLAVRLKGKQGRHHRLSDKINSS